MIRGDQQRLTQVVVNLLANASKFGPPDSVIRIGARAAESGGLEFWIEDEGPGPKDPEDTGLFEQFHRSGGEDPDESGLGLGLFIVRSIVERHGGTVSLERSGENRTRAEVHLPQEPPAVKILLVDDDPDLLAVTGFALQQAGFLVVKAGDGAAALDGISARAARPRGARHQLAEDERLRARAEAARAQQDPVHHADRAQRGGGRRARAEPRRRRLPEQAVQPEDPARARESAAAPRRARGRGNRRLRYACRSTWPSSRCTGCRAGPCVSRRSRLGSCSCLFAHAGRTVPTDRLLVHVWGNRAGGNRQLLKQLVHRLRQKVERDPAEPGLIRTMPNAGYLIDPAAAPQAAHKTD